LNDYEMVMKRKDSSVIYVSASARVVFNAEGQPLGTEGVMRDITERKQAEVREQQRRILLEKVVEMSKAVAQTATFYQCVQAIQQAVQKGLGFDRAGIFLYDEARREVRGMLGTDRSGEIEDISQFVGNIDADDQAWTHALQSPTGFFMLDDYEAYHQGPGDSKMKDVKQNAVVSAWAGDKPMAFIAVDNLITQRPFTPAQLEALHLFSGYAGLAIENAHWKSEMEQRVAERTLQLQESNRNLSVLAESSIVLNKTLDMEQVLDHVLIQAHKMVACRQMSIMFTAGDRAQVARYLSHLPMQAVRTGSSDASFPVTWPNYQHMLNTQESVLIPDTTLDPTWQLTANTNWILSYIGVPLIVNAETVGFLNASHSVADSFDHTDLQLLEALASHAAIAIQNARLHGDLVKALEKEQAIRGQLVHTEKLAALGKMVAVIAHEINNPIQTVKNAFFLIEDEIKPESPAQEYLQIAKSEATRISDLVAQLRETYRTRSKTLTAVNLLALISEVRGILSPQLKKSNITWQQPETFDPCTVFAIRNNLKQVFINLALNAIEAMEKEQNGQLVVSMALSHDERNVGVGIHNTGALISEEALPHIFEPFFTTKGNGTGLGLSISYDIIQQHGGRIEVDSQPAKGVTVTVWLPLALVAERK
jgi:signal transduction histidine kinase